ncbi:acyltransferase [uncultured Roseibium sp.]|uniref:acyltransferase family protein n=1 Tax=uncultured Roseibium sp. TaxID=1936171 RepID=UPI002613DFAD|nr:acyltransferase [uncultured Roseibium sp.]
MTRGLSLYLDAVRFSAAFLVLLSHWAYPRFTGGSYLWIRELNLGSDAVVVFFVLSGLVIAFAAERKDKTGGVFVFNRLTRLYSVALPALLLTFAADRLGVLLWPEAYDGWWYNAISAQQFLFTGLTFTGEWGLSGLRLGTNGPYWSLSYEVAYYCLFAAAVYLRGGVRLVVLCLIALLCGYKPLLLLPAWLAGVWTWKVISRPDFRAGPALSWAMIAGPVAVYGLCLAGDVPGLLMQLTEQGSGLTNAQIGMLLRFSDEFFWNNMLAVLVAVNFAGVAALTRSGALSRVPADLRKAVVWAAGGSFSLYLVHYPLLQFAGSAMGRFRDVPGYDFILLAVVFALSMAFAALFERRLGVFRKTVLSVARTGNDQRRRVLALVRLASGR